MNVIPISMDVYELINGEAVLRASPHFAVAPGQRADLDTNSAKTMAARRISASSRIFARTPIRNCILATQPTSHASRPFWRRRSAVRWQRENLGFYLDAEQEFEDAIEAHEKASEVSTHARLIYEELLGRPADPPPM